VTCCRSHARCCPRDGAPSIAPAGGWRLLASVLALLASACCPEPRGEDATSAAGGDGGSVATVRFATLQQDIFDRRCVTDCHEAVNAGAGLTLARGRSWAALVNQRSQQITTRLRVLPGDVSASYLVKKVEGVTDYVGDRMPKGGARLPQGELDELRTWIGRGAPND
jgi:hypothetical protein